MSELLREPDLFIGGRWRPGGGTDDTVEDPTIGEVTAVVSQASEADVDEAVQAARDAFPSWSRTPVTVRVSALRRLHDLVAERADELAALITREQGSPPPLARKLHVDTPNTVIDQTADALERFPFQEQLGHSLVVRQPVGVVAAITPWNLPLHQVVVKVVPALAAGATVVLKPAELTPLAAFELARLIEVAGFPAGTFNLVPGPGHTLGDQLARHPDVDQVSFTGSTPVGRAVAAAAAQTVKRVTLELGGKSASVVLSDVDDALPEKAVKITVANCYLNAGQTCTALSRLVVPADRLEQAEAIASAAAAKYVPGQRLGPLISAERRKAVLSFLDGAAGPDAVELTSAANGDLPPRGHYVAPAVFSRVASDSRLAQDEVFGPILAILPAETDDAAVLLANDTIYGLAAAVWSGDVDRALDVALNLDSGQIDINGAPFNAGAPFGGFKQSGIGREIGEHGLADVCEIKAVQR